MSPIGVRSGLCSHGCVRCLGAGGTSPKIYMTSPSSTILSEGVPVYIQVMSTTTALPQLYSFGHELEMTDDKVGLMRDSSDAADDVEELRRRVEADGYLYMKGYLDRSEVLAARASLTERLADAGVLDPTYPAIDAVCKPGSGYVF
jgi:hypothetical protein